MAHRAVRCLIVLSALSTAASTLAFGVVALYRYRVAGLSDLQLVLVGSVMEATVFLGEIPTGIVADLYSRRRSVIIGHFGMGLAFLLEAAWAAPAGVFIAGAVWGLAYTFTSGATTAWLAGELGEPGSAELVDVFLRASRVRSAAALVALPLTFAVASVSLRIPLVLAGVVQLALGLWLIARMPETRFEPVDPGERSTWASMVHTGRTGFGVIRASRALLLVALVFFVAGGSSEAFDRYGQKQLVEGVGLPRWFGGSFAWWLGLLAMASAVAGVFVPRYVRRARPARDPMRLRRWLTVLLALEVASLLAFAGSGSFALAAAAAVVVERTRSVRGSLLGALVVPLTPKAQRATVLSALEQADAVSQTTLGPVMGVLGGAFGVPVALAASAVVLLPAIPIIRLIHRPAGERG